jgi:hypothetical protein
MILTIDKAVVVFNGGKNSIGIISKGKYEVLEIAPLDIYEATRWYQIIDTKKIIGLNPKNLPQGISLSVS